MWTKIVDFFIERKLKKSFKLRNDLQKNSMTTVPIEIIKGKYKGIVYQYGQVQFNENTVKFHYDVIQNGHVTDNDFIPFAGRLLMYLYTKKGYHDIVSRGLDNE